jgi:hypothetical protein
MTGRDAATLERTAQAIRPRAEWYIRSDCGVLAVLGDFRGMVFLFQEENLTALRVHRDVRPGTPHFFNDPSGDTGIASTDSMETRREAIV